MIQSIQDARESCSEIQLTATADEVLEARNTLQVFAARLKEVMERADDFTIEWIKRHGEIQCGTKRLYVGSKPTTKCLNVAKTLEKLVEIEGGDIGGIARLLASQPIKHGAVRESLGKDWDKHFVVQRKDEVREGKGKLQTVDAAFLQGKR